MFALITILGNTGQFNNTIAANDFVHLFVTLNNSLWLSALGLWISGVNGYIRRGIVTLNFMLPDCTVTPSLSELGQRDNCGILLQ